MGVEKLIKEQYITIVGFNHYYGARPFKVGKRIKCVKEPANIYDSEAIRAVVKGIGTVGYVANSPYTTATGTKSAGGIAHKVKKKFQSYIICSDGRIPVRIEETEEEGA